MNDSIANFVRQNKSFFSSTELTSISGTSETGFLLIKNPIESVRILITHFVIGTDSSSVRSIFRLYSVPTIISDGTILKKTNTYIKTSPNISQVACFKLPTISVNGNLLKTSIMPSNTDSRGVNRSFWIDPGYNILVTVKNSVSNASSLSEVYWIEGV